MLMMIMMMMKKKNDDGDVPKLVSFIFFFGALVGVYIFPALCINSLHVWRGMFLLLLYITFHIRSDLTRFNDLYEFDEGRR